MAEELDDGEFWLPSHFLTDDDILMDFNGVSSSSTTTTTFSELDFASAESDEDDLLSTHIPLHLSSCPLHSKGYGGALSTSPQSTLYRCVCNQSSSRESVSPPPPQVDERTTTTDTTATTATEDNTTLNLLNKAAGEVARLKLRSENKKVGTGFFDCSQNRVSYPPPMCFQPQFIHFPPMIWAPSNVVQYRYNQRKPQQQQNRATKSENKNNTNNNTNNKNNNRPLGLPLSAWPPLQAQSQAQAQNKPSVQSQPQPQPQPTPTPQKLTPLFVGPPKGTGVFLPRRVATTPANETRKKSDGNGSKSKNGKGSQSQSNNHRRNSGKTTTTTNHNDIQLPQEWTY